jgi:hypothetical protein
MPAGFTGCKPKAWCHRFEPTGLSSRGVGIARRLATIPGVTRVETIAADRYRMIAERDVRPDAAAADVAVNGSLPRPPILMSAGLAGGWTIATRFILGGSSACAANGQPAAESGPNH